MSDVAKPGDGATVPVLAQIDLFAGLTREQLAAVAALGKEVAYAGSDVIFREGEAGETFYVVLTGAVRISRDVSGMGEEALAVIRAGGHFGEMSLIDSSPRSATAVCHERCRLFVIGRQDMEDLLFVNRELAYSVLWNWVRTLSRRLRATNDKMTFLATTARF